MEKFFEAFDFSQGREDAVWEKIVLRLSCDTCDASSSEFDDVAGGLSHITDCNIKLENYRKK